MSKYINEYPNFTIVAPGPCNAKCSFCFWDRNQKPIQSGYAEKLFKVIGSLPSQFRAVSISGGEPTISPALPSILSVLKSFRNRLDRVVLTTNGTKISECTPALDGVVDFVNISRHAVDDAQNIAVFNTKSVPSAQLLVDKIASLNEIGIPVTLSKVLNAQETESTILEYIDFAKSLGASKVFLRRPNGTDLGPHPVEARFSHIRATESGCPVCLDRHQIIRGMPCQWKRGLLEPTSVGTHELVMQPSGEVTFDWAGMVKFHKWPSDKPKARQVAEHRAAEPQVSFTGCGYSRHC